MNIYYLHWFLLSVLTILDVNDELTWQDVEWLRSITKLPVLVKGILTAEDGENRVVSLQIRLIRLSLCKSVPHTWKTSNDLELT